QAGPTAFRIFVIRRSCSLWERRPAPTLPLGAPYFPPVSSAVQPSLAHEAFHRPGWIRRRGATALTPRPRVAGAGRLFHIPRRGNRVPLDVAALAHGDDLLLFPGLVVDDQAVPHAPPLGRRLRGTSGEHERDEQREE